MRHLSVEAILDRIQNAGDSAGYAATDAHAAHLAACGDCSETLNELKGLVHFMADDAANEPSPEALAWSLEIFQPVLTVESGSTHPIRRIARLIFDSFEQPLPAGVRAGLVPIGSVPRQLLFRAGDVDVDLRIESDMDNRISLSGQVLSETVPFFQNTPVRLESHGVARFRTQTNPVGEFSFDAVPSDTYHLSMDLPEGQVTLFCVYRGTN